MKGERKAEGKSLNPGQKLQGEHGELYRIERVCGQGHFGITYEATCVRATENARWTNGIELRKGQKVAIKECFCADTMERRASGFVDLTDVVRGGKLRRLFEKEARMIARCQRQLAIEDRGDSRTGFVPIYQAGKYVSARELSPDYSYTGTSLFYYVMQYVEGKTLKDYVGNLEVDEIVWLLYRLVVVLQKFHSLKDHRTGKRLLHRDIKPHNIMVTQDGYPVLVDYGGTVSGMRTRAYAAPEQVSSSCKESLSAASDVYSLATSFYQLMTSKLPPIPSGVYREKYPLLVDNEEWQIKLLGYSARHGYDVQWGGKFLKAIDRCMRLDPRERYTEAEWLAAVFLKRPPRVWREKTMAGRQCGEGGGTENTLYESILVD